MKRSLAGALVLLLFLLWGCENPSGPPGSSTNTPDTSKASEETPESPDGSSDAVVPAGDALDPRLIGSWRSLPKADAEGYEIGATSFVYSDGDTNFGWDMDYKGVIRHIKRFNDTEGVIIIEYTPEGWPKYTEPGHTVSAYVGTPIPGAFFGVYYSELGDDSVRMANSTTLDSDPPYAPPETKTLKEAVQKFTEKNRDRFVAGVALRQRRYPMPGSP
jgi:hypothetical protein